MESDGDRPARGKSRKTKERAGEGSSSKRPPVLHSEEGEAGGGGGGGKLPASKSKAKASRRAEREPSPDQEEDVIDGFVIVSFRAEESLKNALKKHCNVYENRIMQLPLTRGQGSSSWRGIADPASAASRTCAAAATATVSDATVTEDSSKPPCHSTPKGSTGHSSKGKENKAASAAASACVSADTSTPVATASSAVGWPLPSTPSESPTTVGTCCTEASTTTGKSENAKKGSALTSKQGELDLLPQAGTPTKGIADQGPPLSSSAGPPELSAIVNLSASSTGDLPASPASEGTCQSSCALPSPLHPQVTLGHEAPAALLGASGNSGKESKSARSDSVTAGPQAGSNTNSNSGGGTTSIRNSQWPSTARSGDSKAYCAAATAGAGHTSSAAGSVAWHSPIDGAVTAATSSMNSSQPFYSAYSNPLAAMLGMASAPSGPGGQHSVLSAPNFMANALAAAAAAGLPVMSPAGYPADFGTFNTQDIQRELSCRFLDSHVDRSSLAATLQPYLAGAGSATTASSIQHQQLYDQLLRTAAAAQQQHQQQQAVAAAAVAAAAAGMPALPPPPYGTSLVPTPAPHMYAGKTHKFDTAAMALWGQAMPGAFPPSMTAAAAAAALHGSGPATGASPFQTIGSGIGPVFGDTSANFSTKRSGKWCAAHVRIAWQIFQSQQKSKQEQQQNGCVTSGGSMSNLAGSGIKCEGATSSVNAHLASLAAASGGGIASAGSSRSSMLSAQHEGLHHRTGSGMPSMLSAAASTPPSNSARSPHNTNLSNYSPAAASAAFPTMASPRDLAEWTARLGGAAALLSLAPAVMGWPGVRPDMAKEQSPGDRSSLAFGFGRELNSGGGADSTDSRESHSRGSSSNRDHGKTGGGGGSFSSSASHRPRSRSPIRAKSREQSSGADRTRVKAERRDHEDHTARSADRLGPRVSCSGGSSASQGGDLQLGVAGAQHPLLLQQQQQQQAVASMYGGPMPDPFSSARWLSNLIPLTTSAANVSSSGTASMAMAAGISSSSALPLGDRRLWSPFERNASFESNRGRPHSSTAADAHVGQDVDHRHGGDRPLMDYRLAAAAAAAERIVPFASAGVGSSSRMKLSASAPYLPGLGSAVPGAPVHSSVALNGHRSASVTPSQGRGSCGSGRDQQPSPASGILASAANTAMTVAPKMTSSPGQPCTTMQVNGGASTERAADGEPHSR